ncbi:dienelactone hydrolase family protein [Azospirillum doebereinerae]|uniref:dienelactone hydrolase family protein n=1 Tax=Azospirillum doebereinerae TaxID=92933 RepID=UPI00163CAFB8|nr:dienelactone hydrolase family protein [Azospirillum doebereinerae]MCG5239070.1 dienelactone hydrolase family protein [Azospirillum doebereinerae]
MRLPKAVLTAFLLLASPSLGRAAETTAVTIDSAANLGSAERLALAGILSTPDGPGPFPAVVLLHGCGGLRPNTALWQRFFTERGFVTLAVDSFGSRHVKEICNTSGLVTWKMRAADAFGALEHLARQPTIRRDSILVMGFSHGGGIALDVTSSFRLDKRAAQAPRFQAALALYPPCGARERRDSARSVPTFIAVGADDDWTPTDDCRALAANRRATPPVDLHVYPDTAHSFDNLDRPLTYLPRALNRHSATGFGATVGGNPDAARAVQADLDRFLSERLR